jgi:predicted DNA-binding transcriptional regulator YafY
MRLWRIDRISKITVLEDNFTAQEFNLADYVAQSFGVFQESAQDVVLRFSSAAAEDAADWVFHPSQTIEPQADGTFVVRFRCGGMRELDWHLYAWGDGVTDCTSLNTRSVHKIQEEG